MDPISLIILLIFLFSVCLQVWQIYDFSEMRSQLIEAMYIAIILALVFTTDFLKFL
jgi:hypothetical protein